MRPLDLEQIIERAERLLTRAYSTAGDADAVALRVAEARRVGDVLDGYGLDGYDVRRAVGVARDVEALSLLVRGLRDELFVLRATQVRAQKRTRR